MEVKLSSCQAAYHQHAMMLVWWGLQCVAAAPMRRGISVASVVKCLQLNQTLYLDLENSASLSHTTTIIYWMCASQCFVCVLARQAGLIFSNNHVVIHLFFGSGVAMTDGTIFNNHLIWSGAHKLKPGEITTPECERPSIPKYSGDFSALGQTAQ